MAAAIISIRSISANKDIARKRATLDIIERRQSTEFYQDLYLAFKQVRQDPTGFEQIKDPSSPVLQEQRRKVLEYLNHYELIAIGIRRGILDKDVYAAFMRTQFVRDWLDAKPFIDHIRKPTPDSGSTVSSGAAFEEYGKLADRWAKHVKMTPKATAESGTNADKS